MHSIYVFLWTFNRFQPNNAPVYQITKIIKRKFDAAYKTWATTEESVKDLWFGEFKVTSLLNIKFCLLIINYS